MSNKCGKCHRALKNTASIERGFGPVCWASVQSAPQKSLLDDPAAASDYDYRIDRSGDPVLVITDLDRGGKSVTNNIEAILARIERDEGGELYTAAIIYRDSEGNYDGVNLDEGRRVTFYPLSTTNESDAIHAARMRRLGA